MKRIDTRRLRPDVQAHYWENKVAGRCTRFKCIQPMSATTQLCARHEAARKASQFRRAHRQLELNFAASMAEEIQTTNSPVESLSRRDQ